MKKFLALFLTLVLILPILCSCSTPVIYDEENAVRAWLAERTEGYTQVSSTSMMYLKKDAEQFTVAIATGSNGLPRLEIEYDPVSITGKDPEILAVSVGGEKFAVSTHSNIVFDPYANQYTRSMKIYRKDENTFRIFFWLYGEDTDFYPLPRLLTAEQYQQLLPIFNEYTEKERLESEELGEEVVNYAGIFMDSYVGKYTSALAANPSGAIFYEYNGGAAEYVSVFRDLISRLGLTQQDWRKAYEGLGYTGYQPVYRLVYCDMIIGETEIDLTLNVGDAYDSPAMKEKNLDLSYTFCPNLAQQEFMNVTVK